MIATNKAGLATREEMNRLYDEYSEPPPPRNLGPPLRGAELRQGVDKVNRAWGLA